MPATSSNPERAFELETLEFHAVRALLTERLTTPLGRTAVETLAPHRDLGTAQAALAAVVALAGRLQAGASLPISGVVDVRSWLLPFFAGEHALQAKDLADLKRVLRAAERCRRWLLAGEPGLAALASGVADLEDLVEELEQTIDDRGEVLSTASQKLARLRSEIEVARGAVDMAVAHVLADSDLRKYLQSPEPTWRHGRPVLQVKADFRNKVSGVLHDRSASGATLFIEPDRVVEAANRLSDAQAAEAREVAVVLANVARGLQRLRGEIVTAVEFVAAADLAQAKARLIAEDGFAAPTLVGEGELRLVQARHPILLRQRQIAIVPLDVRLGDPNRVLVVTGPNTGGKTVVLKTIGLLALMALAAVPIPAAAGCQVPMFTAVQADIGDEQGISQNLSTFSSHVQRIARCLQQASGRALVLLDELGAGTDPEEGGVLGYAVLEELVRARAFAVVTTHLGRLKDFAYQHQGAENGSMAFDGRTLAPLYRLDVGIPGNSHALDIAVRVGMPATVVERARALLGKRDLSLEHVIERVQIARRDAEADRKKTQETSREIARQQEELQDKLTAAERTKSWLQEEADAVVESELRQAQAALLEGLQAMLSAPAPHGDRARGLKAIVDGLQKRAALHRRRMRFCHDLKKGDRVFLPRWQRVCVVNKIDKIRETIAVDYGNVKVDVPFEDVSWLQPLAD